MRSGDITFLPASFFMAQSIGAWIAAAILSLNISLSSIGAPITKLTNYLNDPLEVVYTNQEQELDQFFDRSVIQIVENGTIIDGQYYDDIWISTDASEKLRTNAFDFKTAYNISSNSNGTFASGVGEINGLPIFNVNGTYRSQGLSVPYPLAEEDNLYLFGDGTVRNSNIYVSGIRKPRLYYIDPNDASHTLSQNLNQSNYPVEVFLSPRTTNDFTFATAKGKKADSGSVASGDFRSTTYSTDAFDFDYVSGTIPADTPIPTGKGYKFSVPTGSHLSDFLDENPEFAQPGGYEVDVNVDPDISTKLGDLTNILAPLIPLINVDITDQPSQPAPVYDTISNTNYSVLNNTLNNIRDAISSLGDAILEDIETGPLKVFDKVLDIISTAFAPLFTLITTHLGIWSYVVSWYNTIIVPFAWIISVVPGAIMVPVYASVAGALCIAIYRRFGH